MALYVQPDLFSFDKVLTDPVRVFSSRKLRTQVRHLHTSADPFLFVWRDKLYLLYEAMAVNEHGCIAAYQTRDLRTFEHLGIVLQEPHHLSYPLIFNQGSSVFMIPESAIANEVSLYRFENFPNRPKKLKTLLVGRYFDSSITFHEGIWYLFTTAENGLNLFFTDDIERGPLLKHPSSPITTDRRVCRCGGQPVRVGGVLYRLAQDCSERYGGNLNILRILELTPTRFSEEMAKENYFPCKDGWNEEGGHHLSLAKFLGQTVIATDGQQQDYLLNTLMSPVYAIIAATTS